MVRAPCCEKMGLKKGPWTPEEDQILINYILQFGHGNWRALPKQAGLLRCGKSCRLRWTNYLRPDIKRGNFTREEEDTIINLHEMLGNRWSAIAARLPGRTDNEIKNVWHTHLKKRLKQNNLNLSNQENKIRRSNIDMKPQQEELVNLSKNQSMDDYRRRPISPQQCSSSDISSVTTGDDAATNNDNSNNNLSSTIKVESNSGNFQEIDENFWSEVLSSENSSSGSDFPEAAALSEFQNPFSPFGNGMESVQYVSNSSMYDSMDFWYNLFTRAGDSMELPEI